MEVGIIVFICIRVFGNGGDSQPCGTRHLVSSLVDDVFYKSFYGRSWMFLGEIETLGSIFKGVGRWASAQNGQVLSAHNLTSSI